jgi:hypothetical protein
MADAIFIICDIEIMRPSGDVARGNLQDVRAGDIIKFDHEPGKVWLASCDAFLADVPGYPDKKWTIKMKPIGA